MIAVSMYAPTQQWYMAERAARRLALHDYTLDVLMMSATSARNHVRTKRGADSYRAAVLAVAGRLDAMGEIEVADVWREHAKLTEE